MPTRPPASDDSLKRERAGSYRTRDGRFTIEQSSSGWLVLDAEQTDELGLSLARGPFPTLDGAKAAIVDARTAPAPTSGVAERATGTSRTPVLKSVPAGKAVSVPPQARVKPHKPAIVIREIRAVDGDALRALWGAAGFRLLGDDDLGLARLARRNQGLVLVAAEGTRVIGSALGTWDGHRGWIYHVLIAPSHRRQGIATRLIDQVEAGLRALGCPKVNVMVRPDSDGGAEFWVARGYAPNTAVQFGLDLGRDV